MDFLTGKTFRHGITRPFGLYNFPLPFPAQYGIFLHVDKREFLKAEAYSEALFLYFNKNPENNQSTV